MKKIEQGWKRHINPSGEKIWVKTYSRILPFWDNPHGEKMVLQRKQLADICGVPAFDMMCSLEITIKCNLYKGNVKRLAIIQKEAKQ
ncbi:hypothetical protein LCGC14_3113770 [marine sediment metagenome]|uniref:Uncharacterized protein n=1 Tax=marine sediment metagenome TaxID=412755 RepID=A0A0F8YU93_9ZZZZ